MPTTPTPPTTNATCRRCGLGDGWYVRRLAEHPHVAVPVGVSVHGAALLPPERVRLVEASGAWFCGRCRGRLQPSLPEAT